MPSKATNRFSPEVRERAMHKVLDHVVQHPSCWAAIRSIAAKIGGTGQTLNEWVKQAERAPNPCRAAVVAERERPSRGGTTGCRSAPRFPPARRLTARRW